MGRGFYPHSSINCGLCRESTTVVLVPFKTVTQETYEEGMDFVVKVRVTPDFSKWMTYALPLRCVCTVEFADTVASRVAVVIMVMTYAACASRTGHRTIRCSHSSTVGRAQLSKR